eukprot:152754-Chlamydomonas_euryale.AAC.12
MPKFNKFPFSIGDSCLRGPAPARARSATQGRRDVARSASIPLHRGRCRASTFANRRTDRQAGIDGFVAAIPPCSSLRGCAIGSERQLEQAKGKV